jgi:hypothetical protein
MMVRLAIFLAGICFSENDFFSIGRLDFDVRPSIYYNHKNCNKMTLKNMGRCQELI